MLWSVAATRALFCDWKWKWVAQSCLTLCDPVAYTFHGILQARILEWLTFPFSRGSSHPRDWTRSPTLQADSLPAEPQGKPKNTGVGSLSLLQWIFPTQESNWGLLHCRQTLYQLSYQGGPSILWLTYDLYAIPRFPNTYFSKRKWTLFQFFTLFNKYST